MIIESPEGKVIFIDGGNNKLFARHAAARYQYKNTSKDNPMEVEALIITHGDADHFDSMGALQLGRNSNLEMGTRRRFVWWIGFVFVWNGKNE